MFKSCRWLDILFLWGIYEQKRSHFFLVLISPNEHFTFSSGLYLWSKRDGMSSLILSKGPHHLNNGLVYKADSNHTFRTAPLEMNYQASFLKQVIGRNMGLFQNMRSRIKLIFSGPIIERFGFFSLILVRAFDLRFLWLPLAISHWGGSFRIKHRMMLRFNIVFIYDTSTSFCFLLFINFL